MNERKIVVAIFFSFIRFLIIKKLFSSLFLFKQKKNSTLAKTFSYSSLVSIKTTTSTKKYTSCLVAFLPPSLSLSLTLFVLTCFAYLVACCLTL